MSVDATSESPRHRRVLRALTGRSRADEPDRPPAVSGADEVVARLRDGPHKGEERRVRHVEGRPPKTLDVDAADGTTSRYCLAVWSQSGPTAVYTFLYEV